MTSIDLSQSDTPRNLHRAATNLALSVAALLPLVCWPTNSFADNKLSRAKMDLKCLETAVAGYQSRNGTWPVDLNALAEVQPDGGLAFIDRSMLKDPWGRPYHYDLDRRNPMNDIPLIWCEGTNPEAWFATWEKNPHWENVELWNRFSSPLFFGLVSVGAGALLWLAGRCRTLLKGTATTAVAALLAKLALIVLVIAAALLLVSSFGYLYAPRFLS
jgi:hypothetical protein